MRRLVLPRLVSDGMVLEQGKRVHIWGWDEPGRTVCFEFRGLCCQADADDKGNWEFWLEAQEPGGPFVMKIQDDAGETCLIEDILVGDVFVCSGQSNMDIPMARVRDRYPDEVANCANPFIRTFKVMEHGEFHGPLDDHVSGEWWQAEPEHILDFSAAAYFFAKHLHGMTGVPVGLIHASLGGSPVEAWLSREMIEGEAPYPQVRDFAWDEVSRRLLEDGFAAQRGALLEVMERYSSDEFRDGQLRKSAEQGMHWQENLDAIDQGLKEHWERVEMEDENWERIQLPCMFRDTELSGFVGSLWLRREFEVTDVLVKRGFVDEDKMLWLGTLVDSDTVYVNGQQVGQTGYQYPPRKYPIPAGLLRPGSNTIVIRLKCEHGEGRVTPDKEYKIFDGIHAKSAYIREFSGEIRLEGEWEYRVGAICEPAPETDFVNWKPAALYNGMMAPNRKYTIGGFLWYQGESNTGAPAGYLDLLRRLIGGYRRLWNEETLPFYLMQLPNFQIDLPAEGSGWRELREKQRLAQQLPHVRMAVGIDIGEDNDLHPTGKEDVGKRLALLAAVEQYALPVECSGPVVEDILVEPCPGSDGWRTVLSCGHAEGLCARDTGKGQQIADFELLDEEGNIYPTSARLDQTRIILQADGMQRKPAELRYCYRDTNAGALIYNREGLPIGRFA